MTTVTTYPKADAEAVPASPSFPALEERVLAFWKADDTFNASVERNPAGGNWIQWQRCIGARNEVSSYGVEGDGATGTGFAGMGPPGQELQAPVDGAVMFAEVVYAYKPIIHERLLGETIIRARSAFLVRERRDLDNSTAQVNPDDNATEASCAVFAP